MKKFAFLAILVLFFLAVFNVAFDVHDFSDSHVMFGDEEIEGPLGWLIGLVAGGFGLLVAAAAMLFAGIVVALVFAGLGVMAVLGVALGAVVLKRIAITLVEATLLLFGALLWRHRRARPSEAPATP